MLLTAKELQDFFKITRNTYQKWKTKPNFPKEKNKKFVLNEVCKWIIDNLDRKKSKSVRLAEQSYKVPAKKVAKKATVVKKVARKKVARKREVKKKTAKQVIEEIKEEVDNGGLESALVRARKEELYIYNAIQEFKGNNAIEEEEKLRVLASKHKNWADFCTILKQLEESFINLQVKKDKLVDVDTVYSYYYELISSVKTRLENLPQQLMISEEDKKIITQKINFILKDINEKWRPSDDQ